MMQQGFSLLECLVALTLSLGILSIAVIQISQTTSYTEKISQEQDVLESIFHTVDSIKGDLNKCGMRLQEAACCFNLEIFSHSKDGFCVRYGVTAERSKNPAYSGERWIETRENSFFKPRKRLLIYNSDFGSCEFAEIKSVREGKIELSRPLAADHQTGSSLVVIKEIHYRLYSKEKVLKRRVDRGHFQPLMENATDFYLTYFADSCSVLYRLEVNRKEQIRGYIHLVNMVTP